MKLHLGCGNKKIKDYINCDVSKQVKPDKIVDLEKKLPFENNSVDEIIIEHVLEHVNNFLGLMEEIYRISKKEGLIKIKVPYFAHPGAFQDPPHVRFFTLKTFDYFSYRFELNYYSKARFKIREKKLNFFTKREKLSKFFEFFINISPNFYERFISRIFPAEELYIELVKK